MFLPPSLSFSSSTLSLSLSPSLSLSDLSLSLSLCLPAYLSLCLSISTFSSAKHALLHHLFVYCSPTPRCSRLLLVYVQREAPSDIDVVTGDVRRDQDIVNNIGRNEGGKFWATKAPNFWTESRRQFLNMMRHDLPWRTLSGRCPTK